MPSYTFHCTDCGQFTVFFKSMAGNKEHTACPNCKLESKRVYCAPNVYSLSRELSSRIEKGMEPQIMTREQLGTSKKGKKASANRPWQVG
ncbi:zinc ribbon domain-containing protein [Sporosarcina sp. NPDC096371]|uniref:FmdB family zinc ribbon protein n=1 Tax=Sporosarcina sp. NPDC096371 TaxID=3364530 RepID=UPI003820A6A5